MHSELFFFSWFWWVCQVNRGHELYCMYTFFYHQVKILSGVVENLSVSGCLWSGHFNIMLHLLSLFIITNFLAEGEPIMKNYFPFLFFQICFCAEIFSLYIFYIYRNTAFFLLNQTAYLEKLNAGVILEFSEVECCFTFLATIKTAVKSVDI